MPQNRILEKMLDRLYASLISGPSLNCRPHSSRQRVDLTSLKALGCISPQSTIVDLLGEPRRCRLAASIPMPPSMQRRSQFMHFTDEETESPGDLPEEKLALRAWQAQKSLLTKLRNLSEDARTYEQDTGVPALNVGYPLLSMPPNAGSTRRTLAPIAFIPITLEVAAGRSPSVQIICHGEGVDLVTPNPALMAWLERETGKAAEGLCDDEEGEQPWQEIRELVMHVATVLSLHHVDPLALTDPSALELCDTPLANDLPCEPAVLPCAVIGLFPASNQGLLRDTRAMIADDAIAEPVAPFVDVAASLDSIEHAMPDDSQPLVESRRKMSEERFVTLADPFQARAVERARTSRGVVIHGPPGTGKSQTITNVIADHLSRGERVLFVCDKRTALDVVSNRLDHLDLGRLCALVHDPDRDQRNLYMKIRAALDELTEVKTNNRVNKALEKIDADLASLHQQLTVCCRQLMEPAGDEMSFHVLAGRWLAIEAPAIDGLDDKILRQTRLAQFEQHLDDVEVIFERAMTIDYAFNPWSVCAGSPLDTFLNRPVDELRQSLASCIDDARVADNARHENIPPFDASASLDEQATRRRKLSELSSRFDRVDETVRKHVASLDTESVDRLTGLLRDTQAHRSALAEPMDAELVLVIEGDLPSMRSVNEDVAMIDRYIQVMGGWKRIFAFGLKRAAGQLLASFGLTASTEDAARLQQFFKALRARMLLTHTTGQLLPHPPPDAMLDDATLSQTLEGYDIALGAVLAAADIAPLVRIALIDSSAREKLIDGLDRSEPRGRALEALERSMQSLDLFNDKWLSSALAQLRGGKQASETLHRLQQRFDTLESILRVRESVAQLPGSLSTAVNVALRSGVEPAVAMAAMLKAVLASELRMRLEADPALQRFDEQRVVHQFNRYRKLEDKKRTLVRNAILDLWVNRQKHRLLAGTGSRLNAAGADLRRRLFVRGKRAMRLRQMIAVGEQSECTGEGDALFDMCPVWMASPETVAQVFPRRAMFDVVIFDEASQCRLEEALPVLTRARRFVIAGDPKQLPPTRFFEASITTSEDEQLETDQDLFEAQQGEVEDLLTAALNLQVEEAYLDVHYRSRNADLIEFSNEHFYKHRLQAIPGHPKFCTRFAPLALDRADGKYEDRCNHLEAQRVVQIVDELLRRPDPPSIGIACFNLRQRDLIVDLLDDKAVDDDDFARRLAQARKRVGEASFEGLFVKNLENVQGDERDHMIISTTYGPTKEGRFYRRFGPLARAGGGRRLNVLVTRARQQVHLVTSIPRDVYLNVEAIPEGATPSGAWLLFEYLRYAEALAEAYEENHRVLEEAKRSEEPQLVRRPIPPISDFAMALGTQLVQQRGIGCDAHWGNQGFCVDLALHHPSSAEDVTIGVLCDFARYDRAPDPVEWEIYRQSILDWTGWQIERVWSPQFFRDPTRSFNHLDQASKRVIESQHTIDEV